MKGSLFLLHAAAAAALALSSSLVSAQQQPPVLTVPVNASTGSYSIVVDGTTWYTSPADASANTLCVAGKQLPLVLQSTTPSTSGVDNYLGSWTGPILHFAANSSSGTAVRVDYTFKSYSTQPSVVVMEAAFPDGVDTSNCGSTVQQSTKFPAFDPSVGISSTLGVLTWRDVALGNTAVAQGLGNLGQSGLDAGPVVSFAADAKSTSLVWSTLTSHKIVVQTTTVPPTPGPMSGLWSASRSDQVLCLSALCTADQKTDGNYVLQGVEGWGMTSETSSSSSSSSSPLSSRATLRIIQKSRTNPTQQKSVLGEYSMIGFNFAYSAQHEDNWVGTNSTMPDSTYTFEAENGYIFSDNTAPGTIPLKIYSKAYNSTHTDFAAVASSNGISWCTANGYAFQYVGGYVWATQPSSSLSSSLEGYDDEDTVLEYVLLHDDEKSTTTSTSTSSAIYAIGVTAAISSLPVNWSYSVIFIASYGGPTAATYAWGDAIRGYYDTYRLPSITLSNIGYYTDDGAWYYVWEAFNRPAPEYPAEVTLVNVVNLLKQNGVPVGYLQLDDWWYIGEFYFGNVKSITDWHASNASRLFPNGLLNFANTLDIQLQLYSPFWADDFVTSYNMTESTVFSRTKLVTPEDSYPFFSDFFDLGETQTGGRFSTYEIDFLDNNFAGSASMFESVTAADQWYAGMAEAALERGITLQYCLPSVTDMLESLALPAVVQARSSADYVQNVDNAFQIGGSSLLMGACKVAPSKDTLWTSSPQPATYSDTHQNGDYSTQPHVQLDSTLAVLSLGPVGISDAYNYTDVGLISQTFRGADDGTLLRPTRPLSWVDSVFVNRSVGVNSQDIRSTHAAVPLQRGGGEQGASTNSHYVVGWRTSADVTLGMTDLYPQPAGMGTVKLAARPHIFAPYGTGPQSAGCVDGQAASPSCVTISAFPTIPATGTDLSNFTLIVVYEPLANGAYFLGELTKIVHVSPQRFDYVLVGGSGRSSDGNGPVLPGPSGLVVGVRGYANESITLTSIDGAGVVHVQTVAVPVGGFLDVGV